jgi:transcription antitermination factor NusG
MIDFKVGECVEILTGKYRGDFGRLRKIRNDRWVEVELDYSYIINIFEGDIRKDI